MGLYDLTNDPYETTNLYNSGDDDIEDVKVLLEMSLLFYSSLNHILLFVTGNAVRNVDLL